MASTFQGLWEDSAGCTRLVVVAATSLSLSVSLFGSWLAPLQLLAPPCSVYNVIYRGMVWAMPLSFVYQPVPFGPAWLFFALQVYLLLAQVAPRERQLGSTSFMFWLLLTNSLISAVYLLFMLLCRSMIDPQVYTLLPMAGLWPVIIVAMTLRSLARPDEVINFTVLQIPGKWMPVFLICLSTLLRGQLPWDLIAAISVGYMHEKCGIDQLAQSRRLQTLAARLACISSGSILGGKWLGVGDSWQTADPERGQASASGAHTVFRSGGQVSSSKVRPFSGAGQRLGS
mmetsp:Transcript_72630/g.135686  ORF Transcript_72630/g.135686 Transcript_72630/m.135686 type:complete len:286 (+) Transcript_72630:106-963(+)